MSSVLDEVVEIVEPSPDIVSILAVSTPAFLLSLDVGTSGVRAALFDESGNEIEGARVNHQRHLTSFSDFGELNADSILEQVIETIDELVAISPTTTRIQLISISCFWHSLIGVDSSGLPTTPLLTWADTRADVATKQLRRRFVESEVHAQTGSRFHPSYWPAKLLWLQAKSPDAFANTHCWLGFAEYLCQRLFGESIASVSMASATGLFDQRTCDWAWNFVEALGIPGSTLPAIGPDNCRLQLVEKFVKRWPLLSEARLTTVIGDGAANNIGGGCCARSDIALMVGTSGAMRVVYAGDPPDNLSSALWCYRVDRERVVVGGALSDGGGLYRWLTDSLASDDEPLEIERKVAALEPDSHGLTILPFWSGERSTGWSPDARGTIFGLTQQTKPIEILRASLEAVAFRFALIARALETVAPAARIIATGNALRSSPAWLQIISDVLWRPVMFGGSPESSLRGAALLALEAVGKIGSIEQSPLEIDSVFEPDMKRHARYEQAVARQEELYHRLF